MRTIKRRAVLLQHPNGWKWLEAGTHASLKNRGWYHPKFTGTGIIKILPLILVSTEGPNGFDRSKLVEAFNRSGSEFVWGETLDSSVIALAVVDNLGWMLAAMQHFCGKLPDVDPPETWGDTPTFLDDVAYAALRASYAGR